MGNQLDTEVEHEELAQTCGKEKADVKRARYLLAIVDEKGIPVRPATKDEAEAIARTLCQDISNNQLPCLKLRPDASSEPANAEPKPIGILSKHGGPCRHCGTTVSPQWRRGPPSKPILCNACGTRYRRTNQLSPMNSTAAANAFHSSSALSRKKRQRTSNDEDEFFQPERKHVVGGCGRW